MIGHLIEGYCLGRRDAKAGRRRRPQGTQGYIHVIYRQGYADEVKRMADEKRLPQLALELWTADREGAPVPGE